MRILQHIRNIIFQRESCEQDCWAMVVCRNEAKMFRKMLRMIAMVALLCDNAHILPKKHSGTRAIFNFFRAIDNSNFYWKILSLGHFFQVVQMLFSFIFFNTLQHLFTLDRLAKKPRYLKRFIFQDKWNILSQMVLFYIYHHL